MILSLIDAKAGTHFIGKIFVTPHALDRATEHFGIGRADAPAFVMDRLRKAALIDADFVGECGKAGRLFTYDNIAFIVAKDEATVITLYPEKNRTAETLNKAVAAAVKRTIRAAQRTEAAELKRLNRERAEFNLMIAQAELELTYTTKPAKIRKLNGEIAGHSENVKRINNEVLTIKRAKATVIKGACAYVV